MNLKSSLPKGVFLTACLIGLVNAATAQSTKSAPADGPSFTRLVRTGKSNILLETRAVHLVPLDGKGASIWLVGAAHIGQASYYKSIQTLLDSQSLVLYEGVKQDIPKPDPKSTQATSASAQTPFPAKDKSTYRLFADAVGLDFQLYDIDYTKKTFKNSDLTWAEVSALSTKQGKDTEKKVGGIGKLLDSGSKEGQMFGTFLQQIKSDPGSQEAMRIVLAEALSQPGLLVGFLGEGTSDVLIKSRNGKVLEDLEHARSNKSVAIFFGAAHMPDMEKRITSQKQYREAEERWLPAISGDESKVTGAGIAILGAFRQMLGVKHSPG